MSAAIKSKARTTRVTFCCLLAVHAVLAVVDRMMAYEAGKSATCLLVLSSCSLPMSLRSEEVNLNVFTPACLGLFQKQPSKNRFVGAIGLLIGTYRLGPQSLNFRALGQALQEGSWFPGTGPEFLIIVRKNTWNGGKLRASHRSRVREFVEGPCPQCRSPRQPSPLWLTLAGARELRPRCS